MLRYMSVNRRGDKRFFSCARNLRFRVRRKSFYVFQFLFLLILELNGCNGVTKLWTSVAVSRSSVMLKRTPERPLAPDCSLFEASPSIDQVEDKASNLVSLQVVSAVETYGDTLSLSCVASNWMFHSRGAEIFFLFCFKYIVNATPDPSRGRFICRACTIQQILFRHPHLGITCQKIVNAFISAN